MERGSQRRKVFAASAMTMMLSVLVQSMFSSPALAAEGPILDPTLVVSVDVPGVSYDGYDVVMDYVLPDLPGISVENVTLSAIGYPVEGINPILYVYNRSTSGGDPLTAITWTPMAVGDFTVALDVLVLNTTDGEWYMDQDTAPISVRDHEGMIVSAAADPAVVDNSGEDRSVIGWTVGRGMDMIGAMGLMLINTATGEPAFAHESGLDLLVEDPSNFSAVEDDHQVDFELKWTPPAYQDVGTYFLNISVVDITGYSEWWNASVITVIWSERPPVMLNDTIFIMEDTSAEIDLDGRFDDVNGDPVHYRTGLHDANLTVLLNGSVLSIGPAEDWYGVGGLEVIAGDWNTDNVSFNISVVVTGINDAPRPVNDTIVIDWNSEALLILGTLFWDPEEENMTFQFMKAGPHLEWAYDAGRSELSITPEEDWSGSTYVLVNASDGSMWRVHNITIDVQVPVHYVTGSVVYQSAAEHIPGIPPAQRAVRITFASDRRSYDIIVNETGSFAIAMEEGTYNMSIALLIPESFLYNWSVGRSGYAALDLPPLDVDRDTDIPLSIAWKPYIEPLATWDDIDFDRSFMNRTGGEWTITIPVTGEMDGFAQIPLRLAVLNDPDRNETLFFDFFWDEGKRSYVLELKKADLRDFESGELSYYFTDGVERTADNKTVFITKDSRENSIVVIAILVVLILLVMVALVLIMRKPADEEEEEIMSRDVVPDSPCMSCGERVERGTRECPNCGSILEE